jgi:hypothetical protein
MVSQCCVPLCHNRGGHRFPKDDAMKKRWIQAVKRGERNWQPSKHTVVCTSHFDEGDYKMLTVEGNLDLYFLL